MRIRKALIPAAGLGTRLLPASKVVPKELLPIVDRPMLHYTVLEALQAGITQFIIVTSSGKGSLVDYFHPVEGLESQLLRKGDMAALAKVRELADTAEFTFVHQNEQLGLGHAVYTARHAIGDEPFAVLLPDDVIASTEPTIGQTIKLAQDFACSVVAVEKIPGELVSAYGVIKPRLIEDGVYEVLALVEKPPLLEAPSDLGIVGRYVLTPEVFDALERVAPGSQEELQLTDGLSILLQQERIYAHLFEGRRHDVGNPLGLLQASVEFALHREDIGPAFKEWLGRIRQKE